MPRQKRWALKRQCDRTVDAIEKAQEHLVVVYEEFAKWHPAEAQQLYIMGEALGAVSTAVAKFRDNVI
jgi:hypothetical protein